MLQTRNYYKWTDRFQQVPVNGPAGTIVYSITRYTNITNNNNSTQIHASSVTISCITIALVSKKKVNQNGCLVAVFSHYTTKH